MSTNENEISIHKSKDEDEKIRFRSAGDWAPVMTTAAEHLVNSKPAPPVVTGRIQ